LIMIAGQVLFFVPGCEQIKDYRKKVYYEKGLEFYEAKQYKEALDQLDFAFAFDGEYLDALILRAMCYFELNDFMAAGAAFHDAYLIDDSRDDLILKSADSLYRAEKFSTALVKIDLVLAKDPGNPQVRCLEARIRLRSRKLNLWVNVDSILQPLLDDKEYSDQAFALLAEFHILNDNLEKAELILTEHANVNEDWLFVMRVLAKKYVDRNDYQAAVKIYRKILELQPNSTQDIDQLLTVMRRSGSKEDERQLIVSLIDADGQQIHYQLALIDFYIHYEQFAEAEEASRAGLEQGAAYFDFSRCLIDIYEKTNRYKDAIQVVKDVLGRIEKEEALDLRIEFMSILAQLYYLIDNREMTKAVVRWILDLERDNHIGRFLLARIALDEGRTLLAIAELRGLGAEDTSNPDYDYYNGLAHMARGEKSIAEQSFKDCLKKKPSYKSALLKISELYFEKGYFVDLKRMTDEFLTISPNDPDVLALQADLASKTAVSPEGG
jgi:tetratricopeptide (TPR) repeat protein